MLPFMDKKKVSSVLLARRGKTPAVEVAIEQEAPGSDMDPGLKEAAEDVLRAIEQKSVVDLARALHAAHTICDAMPHMEGEHEDIGEEMEGVE